MSNLIIFLQLSDKNSRSDCDLCGKSFKTINSLKHHQSTIHAIKQYICMSCSAGFAQKALLTKHIKMKHTKDENLFDTCSYCDKRMSKYQMVTHLLKHTKERYYEDSDSASFYVLMTFYNSF